MKFGKGSAWLGVIAVILDCSSFLARNGFGECMAFGELSLQLISYIVVASLSVRSKDSPVFELTRRGEVPA